LVEHGKHFKTLKGSQNWSSSVASLWIIRAYQIHTAMPITTATVNDYSA